MHDRKPIRFLRLLGKTEAGELWHVQPLFVEGAPFDVFVGPHDVLSLLHTQTSGAVH